MRAPQESLSCQHVLPNGGTCNAPIFGRGRWKWCKKCSQLVRDEKRRQRALKWQSTWRTRHPKLQKIKNALYRQAKKIAEHVSRCFPNIDLQGLRTVVNRDLRLVFDDRPWLDISVAILPAGVLAIVSLKFNSSQQPVWDQPWLVQLIPWPQLYQNGKEYCILVSAGNTDLVLKRLASLEVLVLENGWPVDQPKALIYFPSVKEAFGIEYSLDCSSLAPQFVGDPTAQRVIRAPDVIVERVREFNCVLKERTIRGGCLGVGTSAMDEFCRFFREVVQNENALELLELMDRGMQTLKEMRGWTA
jgi:hypothetical protein